MPTDDTITGAPLPKKAAATSTTRKAPARKTTATTKTATAKKAPARKTAAKKAPARKSAAKKTVAGPAPSSSDLSSEALEQLVRDTAARVAREVVDQLGSRIAQLEKEAKRARKAADRLADLGAPGAEKPTKGKKAKTKKAKGKKS